ncbi:phosphotriesterase family protein [Dyadobacter frigoris]|uniref:Phosphotriesterase n=1 Tax=Dyadobacter frigoris TaxID=2576211 RepID=A0A4V6BI22_9BACT|nr:phosphotriesterase [Dyadobacter frigoris]TKT88593.1 phosphotriesterase [Dyadobacter frigoris]GLU54645.1 aryldialkylphosphatase [Dyadobacter frigoris]
MPSRRKFLQFCLSTPFLTRNISFSEGVINSVRGEINTSDLGKTLIHEHILVDFIGADKISSSRWDHQKVVDKVLPYLLEIKKRGIKSLADCTPAFLGRDAVLLQKLSTLSGLNILTNTGYYGASDNKYLPNFAFKETAEQLASRWITEFKDGIDGTGIKPGFIKIGVNPVTLSLLHQKLVRAAALTHLETGLTIYSHTGPSLPAFEEIEILKKEGVNPEAFVWVHASSNNNDDFLKAAKAGAWISLDGINEDNLEKNAILVNFMKNNNLLKKVLISHDAGWYKPGEENGGNFTGFTTIPDRFFPLLKTKGFTDTDLDQLLVKNPASVLAIRKRRI